MSRPKIKPSEKKKGISISIDVKTLRDFKKKVVNVSATVELFMKDFLLKNKG